MTRRTPDKDFVVFSSAFPALTLYY